ncbi:MAG: NAD(P)H nitroreductase [Bacteroidetes bacterium]|jgi:nitroreductase|nr:NAD(P)H nitroreductase [Bacteroidota bacterium]MBT6686922.1 NAD(P)H nitroreductase [Bacteroidota bacterium]MBT7143224.1 NAD(P)H nitroreductase [Bacteroidota bacterium]MBT7492798.1 NAD(P)H nitroreductase [Bacteroidota bacterium]
MTKQINFLELASIRQSDRGYIDKAVEVEKIKRCLEAARLAPSACNSQPWKFIVVDNPELKNEVAKATSDKILPLNHFTIQAPVLVVVVREGANFTSKFGTIVKKKPYTLIDIGIATEHFCLQAVSEGLGTCILGWFNEKKVKKLLNIPERKRAELIITVGYKKTEDIRNKIRKDFDEIVSYNSY